jgi:hypothetical protein
VTSAPIQPTSHWWAPRQSLREQVGIVTQDEHFAAYGVDTLWRGLLDRGGREE